MEKAGGRDEGSPEGERSQGQPGGINIQGNDYRLIAVVQYDHDVLMIRFLGSHGDYDKVDAENARDPAGPRPGWWLRPAGPKRMSGRDGRAAG